MRMENLNEQIRQCRKCRLWKCASNAVPGEGPVDAKVMLVGQNPGREEDKVGRPFVGRSGRFLDKMLTQKCINRKELFITSVVKHASPNNRKPLQDEIDACLPYLIIQLQIIKPKIVVLMGVVAMQTPRIAEIEYFKTVHPSAAMRFKKMENRFAQDLEVLANRLHEC